LLETRIEEWKPILDDDVDMEEDNSDTRYVNVPEHAMDPTPESSGYHQNTETETSDMETTEVRSKDVKPIDAENTNLRLSDVNASNMDTANAKTSNLKSINAITTDGIPADMMTVDVKHEVRENGIDSPDIISDEEFNNGEGEPVSRTLDKILELLKTTDCMDPAFSTNIVRLRLRASTAPVCTLLISMQPINLMVRRRMLIGLVKYWVKFCTITGTSLD
jgi:hypothetical protein